MIDDHTMNTLSLNDLAARFTRKRHIETVNLPGAFGAYTIDAYADSGGEEIYRLSGRYMTGLEFHCTLESAKRRVRKSVEHLFGAIQHAADCQAERFGRC